MENKSKTQIKAVATLAMQSEDKYTRQACQRRQDDIYFHNKSIWEYNKKIEQEQRRAEQAEAEIEKLRKEIEALRANLKA